MRPESQQHCSAFRMPAEWEPHESTWITWPHDPEIWPNDLSEVQAGFARMVAALARSELVRINVWDAAEEEQARQLLQAHGVRGNVQFHHVPTNDEWCRDYGAIFVVQSAGDNAAPAGQARAAPSLAATCWRFNSWGDKFPPYNLDAQVARRMAETIGVPCLDGGMVLEGGSIEVNGEGVLLTTASCLLNPNRNPHLTRRDIEEKLGALLGIKQVVWLKGGLLDDRTDGHIDNVARFVSPDTLVAPLEDDPTRQNYGPLQENVVVLQSMVNQRGEPFRVVPLPTPPRLIVEGQEAPASYANFYIANRVVLVPCFHHENDQRAMETLRRCFPDREVVGVDALAIIQGEGAFHCLTQQVPAFPWEPIPDPCPLFRGERRAR